MQAVILAGGLGKRLGKLTANMPKAMVPIKGKPFLFYLLRLLQSQGIGDIVLCIGYLGHQIREYFGHGQSLGIDIKYSEEGERLLGTGGALKYAQPLLGRSFWVINGDTYLPVDYGKAEGDFVNRGLRALMIVYNNEIDTGVRNNVALDSDQRVVGYDKKGHNPDMEYVEAGALALQREVLDLIREGQKISLEEALYPILIKEQQMAGFVSSQRFYDIGTPEQRKAFEEYIEEKAA